MFKRLKHVDLSSTVLSLTCVSVCFAHRDALFTLVLLQTCQILKATYIVRFIFYRWMVFRNHKTDDDDWLHRILFGSDRENIEEYNK